MDVGDSIQARLNDFRERQIKEITELYNDSSKLKPFLEGTWGHSLYNENLSESPAFGLLGLLKVLDDDTREKFIPVLHEQIKLILRDEATNAANNIKGLESEGSRFTKGELLRGLAELAVYFDIKEAGTDILNITIAYAPEKINTMRGALTSALLNSAFRLEQKLTYDQVLALQDDTRYMQFAIRESTHLPAEQIASLNEISLSSEPIPRYSNIITDDMRKSLLPQEQETAETYAQRVEAKTTRHNIDLIAIRAARIVARAWKDDIFTPEFDNSGNLKFISDEPLHHAFAQMLEAVNNYEIGNKETRIIEAAEVAQETGLMSRKLSKQWDKVKEIAGHDANAKLNEELLRSFKKAAVALFDEIGGSGRTTKGSIEEDVKDLRDRCNNLLFTDNKKSGKKR